LSDHCNQGQPVLDEKLRKRQKDGKMGRQTYINTERQNDRKTNNLIQRDREKRKKKIMFCFGFKGTMT
jgi:hypothetical protein